MVHQELSLADQYSKFEIPPSDVKKLLSTMPPSGSKTFRVDFRSDHVHYLNNLEADSKYKRWHSNLNEDLPNYAQHTVPIVSLPQEWIWCESWCGNATKSKAKTIDLCNNPMTKEPKLQGATRSVAECPDLDYEAWQFIAEVLGETLEPGQKAPPSQDSAREETPAEGHEWKAEL